MRHLTAHMSAPSPVFTGDQRFPHARRGVIGGLGVSGLRVATKDDAPFVSRIIGEDASECMGRVLTLITDYGGFFFDKLTRSVYEVHMFFLPEGRGRHALQAARDGLRYMFDVIGALVLFGRIPLEDRAARLMTRFMGLESEGVREQFPGGPMAEWFEVRSDRCRL